MAEQLIRAIFRDLQSAYLDLPTVENAGETWRLLI
jgi:hypothetical protein